MNIVKNLFHWLTGHQFTLYMGGGGGGGQANTTYSNTSNIPEYAQPYVEQMFGAAQKEIFNFNNIPAKYTQEPVYDMQEVMNARGLPTGQWNKVQTGTRDVLVPGTGTGTASGIKGYTPFSTDPNAYLATFSPAQQQSFQSAANMQVAPQEQAASDMTAYAGAGAMNTNYQPGQFSVSQAQAPNLQNYQMQGPGNVYSPTTSAAQLGNAPQADAAQFNGPGAIGYNAVQSQSQYTPMMDTAQTGYNPQLQNYQMQGPQNIRSQQFNQNSAQQYMNPYMQSVVGVQQAEAQRQADIASTQRGARAAQAGAFGGSRQAIENAEANRALASQQGAIQAQGLNTAYSQAQQQFNADQTQRMQAAMANQQAGLQTGQQNLSAALGVQQLGAQTGVQTSLANLSSAQQANVQNQAAQLQTQGLNAQQAMQAALANQQAGINTSQFNATNAYNTGLQNAQMRQQTGLANQALQGQYGLQQGQFQQAANAQNAQQGLQAGLANQTMGYNVGNQNLQSMLGVQQLGAGQNMQAQLANQQAYQQAQAAAEQSRQYGAGLGMQGYQTGLQAAGQLGQLGQNIYGQQTGIAQLQNQYGAQQQALEQSKINQQIQDYATAQQYPMMQLANMSALTRGMPMQNTSTSVYQAAPSIGSQLAGLGTAAYGLSQLGAPAAKAKGGRVKEKRPAGLNELALMKMQ